MQLIFQVYSLMLNYCFFALEKVYIRMYTVYCRVMSMLENGVYTTQSTRQSTNMAAMVYNTQPQQKLSPSNSPSYWSHTPLLIITAHGIKGLPNQNPLLLNSHYHTMIFALVLPSLHCLHITCLLTTLLSDILELSASVCNKTAVLSTLAFASALWYISSIHTYRKLLKMIFFHIHPYPSVQFISCC